MPGRSRAASLLVGLPLVSLLSVLVGCGESGTHVSGKVTFNGQPVPAGKVYIEPDAGAGNSGASGFADIKNGVFDTKLAGGRAATPGAVIFRVEGLDPNPPAGAGPDVTSTVLFTGYTKKAEIPAEPSVQDIDVPPEASKGPKSIPESGAGSGKINP